MERKILNGSLVGSGSQRLNAYSQVIEKMVDERAFEPLASSFRLMQLDNLQGMTAVAWLESVLSSPLALTAVTT